MCEMCCVCVGHTFQWLVCLIIMFFSLGASGLLILLMLENLMQCLNSELHLSVCSHTLCRIE